MLRYTFTNHIESPIMLSKALLWCWEQSIDKYTNPVLLLSVLLIALTWWKLSRKEVPMPPGPWGLPLVGNLPFLDPDLHSYFAKLSLKYGPVFKLKLGSRLCIVISSSGLAKEVLKDHDVNFADHDAPAVAMVATYGGFDIAFAPYGEHWRMMRKVCIRELLSHGSLKALYGLRQREVRDMVIKIRSEVGSPVGVGEHVLVAMFKIITSMMWGNTLMGEERHSVAANFRKASQKMVELLGEVNISDFFPVLARFDIQGKERHMQKNLQCFDQIFEYVIDERRKIENKENATTKDSLSSKDFLQVLLDLMDQKDRKTPFTIKHLKALFSNMTVAGTKTTSTVVEWAMAELLNQPELMKKAQEELDRVVGLNNVVEETHLPNLPYLDSIIKEVLRLHPVGPLLIPRCPRESRIIGGYLIPKGAKVFVNAWALQRDPTHWKDPSEFRPERFLDSSVQWDYTGNDHRYLPFGSGRRICVAASVADRLIGWLLGSLLHSFDWRLPDGVKLDLEEQFGFELRKKIPLLAVPTTRLMDCTLYQATCT